MIKLNVPQVGNMTLKQKYELSVKLGLILLIYTPLLF